MFRVLKALVLASAIAAFGIVTASCNSNNQTQIRFVHVIEDAGALDIDVNGTKYFTNIAFTGVQPASGYTVVPEGIDTIQGLLTGSSTVAFNRPNVTLPGGRQYTVVATGFDTGFEGENVVVLTPADDNREPANGMINFRVINASPDSPGALDIYIQKSGVQTLTPPATIGSLAYEQTSKYILEPYNPSGSGYTVYVCPAGSTAPIFQQNFVVGGPNEGSIRTLILTDQQGIEQLNPRFVELDDLN
jgi:hypothetical protein